MRTPPPVVLWRIDWPQVLGPHLFNAPLSLSQSGEWAGVKRMEAPEVLAPNPDAPAVAAFDSAEAFGPLPVLGTCESATIVADKPEVRGVFTFAHCAASRPVKAHGVTQLRI